MKKVIIFIALLAITLANAQPKISPYFPEVPLESGQFQTQFTYYDLTYVNLRVQNYLDRNMRMRIIDTKYNLKEGIGTIDYIYEESITFGKGSPQKLFVSYSVEPIGHDFVIKSCKIYGADFKVRAFYVGFWKTSFQLDELKAKSLVYNNYLQDKVSYNFNGGSPTITIINQSITNFQKFQSEYLAKRIAFDKSAELRAQQEIEIKKATVEAKLLNEKKQLAQIEQNRADQLEEQKAAIITITEGSLVVTKRRNSYKLSKQVSDNLFAKIKEYLANKEDGEYDMRTETHYRGGIEIKNIASASRFKKAFSFGI